MDKNKLVSGMIKPFAAQRKGTRHWPLSVRCYWRLVFANKLLEFSATATATTTTTTTVVGTTTTSTDRITARIAMSHILCY